MSAAHATQTAHAASPRPWATYYFAGKYKPGDWSRIGRASTLHGAIRAALRHLLEGQAQNAVVHNEAGIVAARLSREGNIIRIVGVV